MAPFFRQRRGLLFRPRPLGLQSSLVCSPAGLRLPQAHLRFRQSSRGRLGRVEQSKPMIIEAAPTAP